MEFCLLRCECGCSGFDRVEVVEIQVEKLEYAWVLGRRVDISDLLDGLLPTLL
jgi:hypothetical protein